MSAPTAGGRPSIDPARLVAQVADYAIISLDPDGTITSWNAGATRLKGYREADALGLHFSVFYTHGDRADGLPQALLDRAREVGSVQHSGWRVRADGTRFWGDVVITAVHDDDGHHIGFAKVTRDLTAQHELEESLRRSEQRFRLLVEQVVDYAIIMLDETGTIETWNAGAERLKGYTAEEAVGRHFSLFYTPEDRAAALPGFLLGRARERGSVEHTGWRVRSDGILFWGDVTITALHDEAGELLGFAKVTRDLTDRKRFEDARQTFFDTFAHDFRTPVSAIAGFARALRDADPEMVEMCIDRIESNAHRLAAMTADLVEHSRARASGAAEEVGPVDLPDVVAQTLAGLPGDGTQERLHVDLAPCRVLGDRASLERILVNLVTNALRYSPPGSPVTVSTASLGQVVRLEVSDHGRGIAPEDLPTIFDEFERGRLATADGGTGLGLTSVRMLAERMGGTVEIDSVLAVGTTVRVLLHAAP